MKKGSSVPHNDYSVDEILAETKVRRDPEEKPDSGESTAAHGRAAHRSADAESIARSAREALNMEAAEDGPPSPPEEPKKKKKRGLFSRRREKKEQEEAPVPEDDIYYGLQLKSLEEYRRDYEATISLDPQPFREIEKARRAKLEAEHASAPSSGGEEPKQPRETEKPAEPGPGKPRECSGEADGGSEKAAPGRAEPAAPENRQAGEPERPAGGIKAQAKADAWPEPADSRQDMIEKIMRHAGLGPEDVFGAEDAIPKPEFPVHPPRTPKNPTAPPVPPAVEPGPPLEPEQQPPIQEPVFSPAPVAEEQPRPEEESAADLLKAIDEEKREACPETPSEEEPGAGGGSAEAGLSAAAEDAVPEPERGGQQTPNAIREPEAPVRRREEPPAPPAAGEPPFRKIPRYRSAAVPLHVVELNGFDDALSTEAGAYGPPPIHAPEPIPFPAVREDEGPAEPTEKQQEDSQQPEDAGKVSSLPLPDRQPETKKRRAGFRLFGSDEDPAPADGPPDEPEEEIEDYSGPGDAPSVLNDLLSNVRKAFLRFAVLCLFALLAAGFAVAWENPALLTAELHKVYTAQAYLIVQLILLAVSGIFCFSTFRSGLRGLFRLQANSESAVAVAALAAAAQNVVFLGTGFPDGSRLYSVLAVVALCLDSAGKLSAAKRILRNFRFLTSPEQKYAVQVFDDYNTAIQMTSGLSDGGPKIAYQTKAGFLTHFLKHSYASDPGEHVSQVLAPAGFLGSLALCITAAVLTKDASAALTAFTASACLCVPFGGALSVSLPLARLNRLAARCGGMTVGWDAVERFAGTDAVLVDAQDLFPRGTVVLNGIQTFAGQRIDEAILDATALTGAVGGTLSDLFSQIVKTRGEVLPKVERPAYEEGLGISGTVSDRVILVGTGELLRRHGVDAPSHDYEEKYRRAGKIPVYLASGGVTVAMFLVFYRSDRRRAAEMRRLEANGIALLVRTRDPNITPELISDCFGLSRYSVSVLPERLGNVYASLQAHPPERASAVLATKGRVLAMLRLLTACARQKSNITVGVALQTAGAALGFALAAFFTACGGLRQLSATSLLLFEAFWTAAVVFIPKIRRP